MILAIKIEEIVKDIESGKVMLFDVIENYEKQIEDFNILLYSEIEKVQSSLEAEIEMLENRL